MWARIVEFMLGVWLLLSPLIFESGADSTRLLIACGVSFVLIVLVSLLSYLEKFNQLHFLTSVVGIGLLLSAFLYDYSPPPPAYQNFVVVGLLLLMFGVLPNRLQKPPKEWREFYLREDS